MPVDSTLKGLVRGTNDTLRTGMFGGVGQQMTAQFMPDYAHLVAEGRVWRVQESAATASVQALPSTTALLVLGNNEPDDGLWYLGIAVTCFQSVNAGAGAFDVVGLAGMISQLPDPIGGLDTSLTQDQAKTTIKSMTGLRGGTYPGKAIIDQGVTLDTDDDWFPLATSGGPSGVTAAKGLTLFSWLNGIVILPPKTLFAIISTATSGTNTTRKGFIWAEVPRSYILNRDT